MTRILSLNDQKIVLIPYEPLTMCQFIFDYKFSILWSIFVVYVPVSMEVNVTTLQKSLQLVPDSLPSKTKNSTLKLNIFKKKLYNVDRNFVRCKVRQLYHHQAIN